MWQIFCIHGGNLTGPPPQLFRSDQLRDGQVRGRTVCRNCPKARKRMRILECGVLLEGQYATPECRDVGGEPAVDGRSRRRRSTARHRHPQEAGGSRQVSEAGCVRGFLDLHRLTSAAAGDAVQPLAVATVR